MPSKKHKSTLTIVGAYRRLNEILDNYRMFEMDSQATVEALAQLSNDAKDANLPLQINISLEDLNETGINPSPNPSYTSSYEPDTSEAESSY